MAPLGELGFETSFGADVYRVQADPTLAAMATALRVVALIIAVAGGVVVAQVLARAAADRLGEHEGVRALGAVPRHAGPAAEPAERARRRPRRHPRGRAQRRAVAVRAVGPGPPGRSRRRGARGPARARHRHGRGRGSPGLGDRARDRCSRSGATGGRARIRPGPASVASRAAGLGAPVAVVTGLRLALERGRGDSRHTRGRRRRGRCDRRHRRDGHGRVRQQPPPCRDHAVGLRMGRRRGAGRQRERGRPRRTTSELAAALAEDPSFESVAEIVNDVEVTVDEHADPSLGAAGPQRALVVRHRAAAANRWAPARWPSATRPSTSSASRSAIRSRSAPAVPSQALEIVGVTVLPVTEDGGSSSVGLAMRREAADAIGFSGECARDR